MLLEIEAALSVEVLGGGRRGGGECAGRRGADRLREAVGQNEPGSVQRDGALDGVLELADVARPVE